MEFKLLGPVRASVAGRPVNLGVRQQRFVLAVLALEVNRLVAVERLVDLVWPDGPPGTARRIIHGQISRLRSTLTVAGANRGSVDIRRDGAGYVLACEPAVIDVHQFTELLAEARDADNDEVRVVLLDQALGLWRGPALIGTASEQIRAQLCGHIDDARLTAVEDRLDALLRLGRHRGVVDEATPLCAEHPHRFTAVLMRALHESGRSADAMAAYLRAKHWFADELGLDPPADLQRLHLELLRDNANAPAPPPPPSPAQLPTDVATFTGRAAELNRVLAVWPNRRDTSDTPPATVVISALDGMAGVGKTALAVHAAHRLARHFPDGQLFLDLHGYTQDVAPVEPADALDYLLRALATPGEQIPHGVAERAAAYRSRLAHRRMLIVLDNAATEAQVRPLLPGAPGCLVLITSRRRLTGLHEARPLSLDVLPLPDAVELFAAVAGPDRLAGHPSSLLAEVVELCGRLPLAIQIAAARLRARSAWTLVHLRDLLRDHQDRLAELAVGNRGVAASVRLSDAHLAPDQRRLFRLLGLHPGPDVDAFAAAALAGTTVEQARRLLEDLLDTHLLGQHSPGRYRFHDLIRAYASQTVTVAEPEPERRTALTRLLDHYRHAASAATGVLYPHHNGRRTHIPRPATPTLALDDPAATASWLDTELENLVAVAVHAAGHDWPTYTVDLSAILHFHLRTRARYSDAQTLHRHALNTAKQTGHHAGQLQALNDLGDIHGMQGQYESAADCYRQALAIARDTGHREGELNALYGLGNVHRFHSKYEPATDCYENALTIARDIGHREGEVNALNGLGNVNHMQARNELALRYNQQALAIARDTGNRIGENIALANLGNVHVAQGRYDSASRCYEQALAIAREAKDRAGELHGLQLLGDLHRLRRQYGPARDYLQRALTIADETGDGNGRFEALFGLANLQRGTGQPGLALFGYQQALGLAGDLGQPDDQARAHDGLAHTNEALGQYDQARHHWRRTLEILTGIGTARVVDVDVADVRARLTNLSEPG